MPSTTAESIRNRTSNTGAGSDGFMTSLHVDMATPNRHDATGRDCSHAKAETTKDPLARVRQLRRAIPRGLLAMPVEMFLGDGTLPYSNEIMLG